jgi:Tfp pilus assembly protein PilF
MTRRNRRPIFAAVAAAALAAACETAPPLPPPAAPTVSIAALYQRPAERALITGLREYEDGQFDRAEKSLRNALALGLRDARDVAVAHKYLAFLACAFNRLDECEQQFRSGFAADPAFSLTDAEIGHPVWGPVFRRVAAGREPAAKSPEPRR